MAANVVEILVKSTNDTKAGFTEAKAGADEVAEAMDAYSEAADRAAGAAADLEAKSAHLAELQGDGKAGAEELAAAQDAYAAALDRASAASVAAIDAQERLAAADERAALASKGAGAASEASAAKTEESGGLMAGMGGKVKMAMLGVAVGMGLAVRSGMDFQQESTKWVTSAGESASQLGMLQQGVLKLSAQTATSSSQLASGLYMISSAGITGAGGLSVLKAAAEGAKSEGADLSEVTNALTSGINAYGMKTRTSAEATTSATSMMNQMLQTVSQGKMTFQELASSLSAVLPVAAASKISYAQVGGALATMTSMGVSARQGTQDLAATIGALSNVQGPANTEMSQFGISATDVEGRLGQRGLTGTIQMLSEAVTSKMGKSGLVIVNAMNQSKAAAQDASAMLGDLPRSIQGVAKAYLDGQASYTTFNNATKAMSLTQRTLADQFAATAGKAHGFNNLLTSGSPAAQTYSAALGKMMGGATGLNVALMLTGTHAKTFSDNVAAIAAKAGGAGGQVSGFSDVTKETSFQMAKAGDSIKAAGTELGLTLLPMVNAILGPLSSMLAFVAGNKAAAVAFAAVVGGVLAGALGAKLGGALRDMKEGLKTAADGVEWLIGKLTAQKGAEETAAAAAEESAAAQEEAAGDASASWIASAASTVAAWAAAGAQMVAQAAMWAASNVAKVAVVVAENVGAAAASAGAWIMANAAMTAGIGLIVIAVVAAVVLIVRHWRQISGAAEEAFHDVLAVVDSVIGWVKGHWPLLLAILLGPIALAALMIKDHWKQVEDGAKDAFHAVEQAVADALGWVKGHWPLILAVLTGPIGIAVLLIRDHWHQITAGASEMMHDVTGFFENLGARIVSIVMGLAGSLFAAGGRIVSFLANGIRSAIGDVTGAISSVVDEVKSFLPFSPARKGPLSGSGSPDNSGRSIARMIAQGITRGMPDVTQAMDHITGAVAPRGGYGAYAAGGGGQLEVVLRYERSGDKIIDGIFDGMKVKVREVAGGGPNSVQRALGRTWPAGG